MTPKRRFIPNRKHLPPVPGSPSMNEEENLNSDSSENTNKAGNDNSDLEFKVVSEVHTGDNDNSDLEVKVVSAVHTGENAVELGDQSSSSTNPGGRLQSGITYKKKDTASRSSSRGLVYTPSNTSKESGYMTSTQKTEIGLISPTRTAGSETALRVSSQTVIADTPASAINVSSSANVHNLPQVYFDVTKETGKEIKAEDTSRVKVQDLVATADLNQEDSEDFVFTSASEPGTADRHASSNYSSLIPGGGAVPAETSVRSSNRLIQRSSNDTVSTLESLRSPMVTSKAGSRKMSSVAREEQNHLEESLLLDLSTLGSSPRGPSNLSSGTAANPANITSHSSVLKTLNVNDTGSDVTSEEQHGLGSQIKVRLTQLGRRGREDTRTIHPSSWCKSVSSGGVSLPTSRTTASSDISSYNQYSPSFSSHFRSPPKTEVESSKPGSSTGGSKANSGASVAQSRPSNAEAPLPLFEYSSMATEDIPIITHSGESSSTKAFSNIGWAIRPGLTRLEYTPSAPASNARKEPNTSSNSRITDSREVAGNRSFEFSPLRDHSRWNSTPMASNKDPICATAQYGSNRTPNIFDKEAQNARSVPDVPQNRSMATTSSSSRRAFSAFFPSYTQSGGSAQRTFDCGVATDNCDCSEDEADYDCGAENMECDCSEDEALGVSQTVRIRPSAGSQNQSSGSSLSTAAKRRHGMSLGGRDRDLEKTRQKMSNLESSSSTSKDALSNFSKKSFDFYNQDNDSTESSKQGKRNSDSFKAGDTKSMNCSDSVCKCSSDSSNAFGSDCKVSFTDTAIPKQSRVVASAEMGSRQSQSSKSSSSKRRSIVTKLQRFQEPTQASRNRSVTSLSSNGSTKPIRGSHPKISRNAHLSSAPRPSSKAGSVASSKGGGGGSKIGSVVRIRSPINISSDDAQTDKSGSFTAEIQLDLKLDFGNTDDNTYTKNQATSDNAKSSSSSGVANRTFTRSTRSSKRTSTKPITQKSCTSTVKSSATGNMMFEVPDLATTGSSKGSKFNQDDAEFIEEDGINDLTQAMMDLAAQEKPTPGDQMRIGRFGRLEDHYYDDRHLIEKLVLHSEDYFRQFAFEYRDQYFANNERLLANLGATEKFAKLWSKQERALFKLFRQKRRKPKIPYKDESCYAPEKRKTYLPFYTGVSNKESFSLVANLQNALAVLGKSGSNPEIGLEKITMKNALRQLVGKKAQRPSPMEILIVLEKQQVRLELMHKELCVQIAKTTDDDIREILIKREKETWRLVELKHQEILTLCRFIAENEEAVWTQTGEQNAHYLSHLEVEPFFSNRSEFLAHLKHVNKNLEDRYGRPAAYRR